MSKADEQRQRLIKLAVVSDEPDTSHIPQTPGAWATAESAASTALGKRW